MDINAQNISKKNVGIELFWRELISLRQYNYYDLKIDPVDILFQLIRKGESLEFLDGDTLSINTKFLVDLEQKQLKISNKKYQQQVYQVHKVLVSPQSQTKFSHAAFGLVLVGGQKEFIYKFYKFKISSYFKIILIKYQFWIQKVYKIQIKLIQNSTK